MSVDDKTLQRERIANRPKHWVRLVTACNNSCLFCLDMDTPRNVYLDEDAILTELQRGLEMGADKVILSGGEASLHPLFPQIIRKARQMGYERVQTVTNGLRYADKRFFDAVMEAGLGEITYSLHGHTAGLHDALVRCPGSYNKLIKGLVRSVRHRSRHGWPIVNIDVVINKQNVAYIDKIVELGVSLGIKEYDLLHVIPQAEAYRQRESMFYEVREHLPKLQKVFKLNRRPDFHIWTNRFPVEYLEGLEELIQDPHKMIDEVRGRRYHVRRYVDAAVPLECREPDRCTHCFIEPFCTTLERTIQTQNEASCEVWDVGRERWEGALPFGARVLRVRREGLEDLPLEHPLMLHTDAAAPLPEQVELAVAHTPEQLEAWVHGSVPLLVHINQRTAPWLLEHRARLDPSRHRLHQPTHEKLEQAAEEDLNDLGAFLANLQTRLPLSGVPACLAPGFMLHPGLRTLRLDSFDRERGRLDWKALASEHVQDHYTAKSVRCEDCRLSARCEGLHINQVRHWGLGVLAPLSEGDWAEEAEAQLFALHPRVPSRIATGMPVQPVAPSLPGFEPPEEPPEDPLRQKTGLKRSDFLRGSREVT
jgi:MoaA/NifB/PqqE/SkfB family radical SAM enzyme